MFAFYMFELVIYGYRLISQPKISFMSAFPFELLLSHLQQFPGKAVGMAEPT